MRVAGRPGAATGGKKEVSYITVRSEKGFHEIENCPAASGRASGG